MSIASLHNERKVSVVIQGKIIITDDYKTASIDLLIENLPSLRARIGVTQEQLANMIGVSRQTYYSMETRKREMSWTIFLAIVFIFDLFNETSEMLRDLKIYPIDLSVKFNGG